MIVIVITLDRCLFDCAVHSLNLPIGPRVLDFGEAMLNSVFIAAHVKHVVHVARSWAVGVAWRESKLDSVVGQNDVDFVRYCFDEVDQES